MENEFIDRLNKILEVKKPNSKYLSKVKYEKLILHLKELKTKKPKIPNDYRIIKKYDVVEVSNVERLVVPKMNEDDQIKFYVYNEELFSILHDTHLSIGHGRRDRMEHQLHSKYENITRETVMLYLNLCELCQKKSFVIKPITSKDNTNLRCQDGVDIHAQTDVNNYKTHWRAIRETYKNNLKTRKSDTSTAAKIKSKYNRSLSSLSDIRQDKRKKSNLSVGEKCSSTDMVSLIYSDIQIDSFNQTDSTESDEMYPEQTLQNTGSAFNVKPETNYQPILGFKKLSGMRGGKDELKKEQEELALMEEIEEAKYSKNNPIRLFFQSMASTVMTFPPELVIETRKRVNDIVSEMELFANALRTKATNKPIGSLDVPPMF